MEDELSVEIEPFNEDFVSLEDFSNCDIRVVKIIDCEAVPKSKKLLQFTLDDGSDSTRTILSGIHSFYEPEELVGKNVLAILNLPPRNMMGIDSCGMILSGVHKENGEEALDLMIVDSNIKPGSKIY